MPTRPQAVPDRTEATRWMESYPTCRQFAFHHHSALRDYLESRDIRWAGMDYLKRRFRAGTPSSDTHLVWLPFSGALECDHGAGFQPLVAGSAAICPAGHPHWLRLTAPAATGLWLHFNPTPRWSRFDAAPPGIYRDLPLGHVSALVDAYLLPSSGSAAGTVGAKIQALELIVFSIEQALEQVTGGERHGFKAKIEILEARIQKKLTDDWTVARLAAALNMSPSYLHKTMLKHLKLTPMALVTKLRMNKAMSRLIHTDMPLAAIADEVGYANAYAFSNAFKRELGRSPARFRASK